MPPFTLRPFRRADRDQLTDLVNAHAQAVVPGLGASVSTVLSSLERQPGEFIEDPWVSERVTLVAERQKRVVAAAHLLRHFPDERAGVSARDLGEIDWLIFWPEAPAGNPYWSDGTQAADALIGACIDQLDQWGVTRQCAGGELPVHGVYGVPEQWPHVRALYQRAGFEHTGQTEIVYLAPIGDLPVGAAPPIAGLCLQRSIGINGTRLSAVLEDEGPIGYIEVEVFDDGERAPRNLGWADMGNLRILPQYQRRGVATWLVGQAADWLRLAQVGMVLDYAILDDPDPDGGDDPAYRAFLPTVGFRELTTTKRGWCRMTEASG
ncbi:MAG TPA: GNAT family N-acetyltransferase [Streptosporangiaceae bacterium]|nr:GNAT family N-acetyltransferase [Streptosporangiaceae bacterium]